MLYIIKLTDNLDDNLEITRRGSRISLHREMLLEGAAENGPFWTHMRCRTTLRTSHAIVDVVTCIPLRVSSYTVPICT